MNIVSNHMKKRAEMLLLFLALVFMLVSCDNSNNKPHDIIKTQDSISAKENVAKEYLHRTNSTPSLNESYLFTNEILSFDALLDTYNKVGSGNITSLTENEFNILSNASYNTLQQLAMKAEKQNNLLMARELYKIALSHAKGITESNKAINGIILSSYKLSDYEISIEYAQYINTNSSYKEAYAFATISLMTAANAAKSLEKCDMARSLLQQVINTPCSESVKNVSLIKFADTYVMERDFESAKAYLKSLKKDSNKSSYLQQNIDRKLRQIEMLEKEPNPIVSEQDKENIVQNIKDNFNTLKGTPTEITQQSNKLIRLIQQIEAAK